MEASTLMVLLEEAIAQGKDVSPPDLLGALERLKAMLWSKMLTMSCSSTANQFSEAAALLTMPQVAKRLSIPEGRAYELARQGKLPTVRVGKYVRVAEVELETWIARQTAVDRRSGKDLRDFHRVRGRSEDRTPARADMRGHSNGRKKVGPASSKLHRTTRAGFQPPPVTPSSSSTSGTVQPASSEEGRD